MSSAIQNLFAVEYDPYDTVWDEYDFVFSRESEFQDTIVNVLSIAGWKVNEEVYTKNGGRLDVTATKKRADTINRMQDV